MKKLSVLFVLVLCGTIANAQPPLRLKGLKPGTPETERKTRMPGRSHVLVQFGHNPSGAELRKLADRGAIVLSYVPDFAFSILLRDGASLEGLDVKRILRLRPDEKISAELGGKTATSQAALVEFYPDVDPDDGRAIATAVGLRIVENPDLLPNHLLVSGAREQILTLAGWDEVSYIFPASDDLVHGAPVHACASAMTSQGPVGQAIPLIGDGWDGPGLGAASLKYAFENVTPQLPAQEVESEIIRAFSEWADHAQITFSPGNDARGLRTIAILFATGEHGDGYPFMGRIVLAHTFYPFPVDPEPIAGDMHFNEAQTWRIGTGLDLYSLALHETGHALGLGHSDKPGDVMYPYFRMHTHLMSNDIAALQELYAAPVAATSANPPPSGQPQTSPLTIAVIAPPSSVTTSPISLSGITAGGAGSIQVRWANSAASGVAQGSANWFIPAVPLNAGVNVVSITAQDSRNNQVSTTVTVNYQPPNPPSGGNPPPGPNPPGGNPPPPPPPNPNPPQGPDTTPPSLTILSPATNNYSTSSSTLIVNGTATDNVGIASVTWATSNGTSGTASGTTNWSTPPIPLYVGTTTMVITAADAAGNTSWRSLTVTRN